MVQLSSALSDQGVSAMRFLKFLLFIHPAFLTLCMILVVVLLFIRGVPFLDQVELKTYDLRLLARGHVPPSSPVVLALIDEKSLATEGRWPWPRSKLAALVARLSDDGARVIGFDMGFLEPDTDPQNDLALAHAMQQSSAALVLGYFFHMHAADPGYHLTQQDIAQQFQRIQASKYALIRYTEPFTSFAPFFRAYAPKSNLPIFTAVAASSGYFSLQNDPDGVVRWMPLAIQGGEEVFPPLAVVCAWQSLGKPQLSVEVGHYGVEGIRLGQRVIPTDDAGQLLINYLGPTPTFARFSVSDILHGALASGTFTNKIVLIGATATGIGDVLSTPLDSLYPGVEIHATVIDNILSERFLSHPKWAQIYDMLAIILFGTLVGIALSRLGALKGLLCAIGLCLVHLVVVSWLFVHAGIWLNMVFPLLVVAANYLGHSCNNIAQQLQQAFGTPHASDQKYHSLFADVVLLRPQVFQAEQVFFIHRQTGLLLRHVASDASTARDPDLISGMLTAIQDFVQDSFRLSAETREEIFQVGELAVWVEQGALAVLAVVIRGNPPQTVRMRLQNTLATLHHEYAEVLTSFTGEVSHFETCRPHLEACLFTQPAPLSRTILPSRCLTGMVHRLHNAWSIVFKPPPRRRWARYVQTLRGEPGIVVTAAVKRRGTYAIAGLRDPLAVDPQVLLKECGFDPTHVVSKWEPYYALCSSFILTRAKQILRPPETVTLTLQDGVLAARGTASPAWIMTARQQSALLPGITQFQETQLINTDEQQLEGLLSLLAPPATVTLRLVDGVASASGAAPRAWIVMARQRMRALEQTFIYCDEQLSDSDVQHFTALKGHIDTTVLRFLHQTIHFAPAQDEKFACVVADMQRLYTIARNLDKSLRITVIGHTDASEAATVGYSLSQRRADFVLARLHDYGIAKPSLSAVGVGMKAPLRGHTRRGASMEPQCFLLGRGEQ